MTTSQKTTLLSEPTGNERVAEGTFAYFAARNRNRIHDLVLKEFKKSGLSQADLARRLGRRPDVVCRLLGAPGNWGLDTVSNLLFAISGSELVYQTTHPLRGEPRNYRSPEYLDDVDVVEPAPALKILEAAE